MCLTLILTTVLLLVGTIQVLLWDGARLSCWVRHILKLPIGYRLVASFAAIQLHVDLAESVSDCIRVDGFNLFMIGTKLFNCGIRETGNSAWIWLKMNKLLPEWHPGVFRSCDCSGDLRFLWLCTAKWSCDCSGYVRLLWMSKVWWPRGRNRWFLVTVVVNTWPYWTVFGYCGHERAGIQTTLHSCKSAPENATQRADYRQCSHPACLVL